MYIKAFAKINLYLDVLNKRDDEYHNMKMVILPLELHDLLHIEYLPYLVDSYITCDHVDLKESKYNLITQTINKLREIYKFKQNFNITVHKEIPIKAGLGGGSSNAAATLKALNKILNLKIDDETMKNIAVTLGADVPYCLINKPSIVTGIGENIEEIKIKHQYYVLILKPEVGLSTRHVFELSDTLNLEHGNIDDVVSSLENGDDETLAKAMFNSLEKASITMAPIIQEYKEKLISDGFKMVLMSGSGSCVYALTTDKNFAKTMYHKYERNGYEVYLTRTLK